MAASGRRAPLPGGDWFSSLFGFAESSYDEAKQFLQVLPSASADGPCFLKSKVNGAKFNAGSFSTPTLSDLRKRGQAIKSQRQGCLKVSNELGDVAKKHVEADNRFATFQVASQFNCLEFVGPGVTPEHGVTGYIHDRTQGPACSIACGPATVYRNYFAPVKAGGSTQKGQTREHQVDNLSDVSRIVGNVPTGKLFHVKGGYTLSDSSRLRQLDKNLMQLTEDGKLDEVRAALRIGVHSDVQVTSCNWGTHRVTDSEQLVSQVFGSACAVAYNHNSDSRSWRNFASIILEASYEATLWAALLNAHRHNGEAGSRRVFLTCLGGGVFGNSMSWIMQAMRRAFEQFKDTDLDIRIVTYSGAIDGDLLAVEEEYQVRASQERKKKRSADAAKVSVPKRAKSTVAAPSSSLSIKAFAKSGESTPSGKKKVDKELPVSPPKADSASTCKRSKASAGKSAPGAPEVTFPATVLQEAEKLEFVGALRNLASRPEIMERKVTPRVLLEALKESNGLVNPAKRAILGH